MKVHDLTEVNVEAALEETFTTTTILTEKRNAENQPISVSFSSVIVASNVIALLFVQCLQCFDTVCYKVQMMCIWPS